MSDKAVRAKGMKKVVSAENLGKEFAKVANTKGIKEIVFDRNGYKFHGRIKAFAESVRASGLKF
jgi:large subunit ribosomal protein L18